MIYIFVENLKKLEVNKLLRELEYVNSDFVYKSELLTEADVVFMKSVDEFLITKPVLKEAFDGVIHKRDSKKLEIIEQEQTVKEEISYEIDLREPKLKSLYRNIAKTTHPDKIGDTNFKELYLDATEAYEKNNLLSLLSICDKLKIPYDVTDEELELLKQEIKKIKLRLDFLETTFTWKWMVEENKEMIILNYIKSQMNFI